MRQRGVSQYLGVFALVAVLTICAKAQQSTDVRQPPSPSPAPVQGLPARSSYQSLRQDEDWSFLHDPAQRIDYLDSVKYIPLRPEDAWYLSLGGEVRERYERFGNPTWGQEPKDDNGYFLQRYALHADFHLGSRVRFFAQVKSGLENGRTGGPRPTDENQFDLHQAFFDLKFGFGKSRSLVVRAGRQEMAFGSSRLISVRESPNVRQSFDGLRAALGLKGWRVDGFITKPVETDHGIFDDATDHTRTFWGVYAVRPWRLLPGGRVDLYYLGIDRKRARFDQGTAREKRHSVGTRLWGKRESWDYNYELVYQWGSFGRGDIRAWTLASDNGYTMNAIHFRPRLGLKADVTSGDRDPASPRLETFNALFPRGAYFGEIALIGPANHIDLHPSVEVSLREGLKLTVDTAFFWRESLNDGIYGPALNLLRSGRRSRARFVGSQPSLQVEWQLSRHVSWTGVVSHFFIGSFLQETDPSRNVSYATMWITYKF